MISDAWEPQVNGVVRTLSMVLQELRDMGCAAEVIGPNRFRTLPCPTYPDIRLSVLPRRSLAKMIDNFAPDALHISTEGPLGMAARALAVRRGWRFTTAFHTRFAEYLHARTRIPTSLSYAWLRHFHGAGAGLMVATQSLRTELAGRGFHDIRAWTRGVDLDLFQPGEPEAWPFPRPIFAYVGRVAVEKNIGAFLALDLPGSKVVVGDGPARAGLERRFPDAHFRRHAARPAIGIGLCRRRRVRVPLGDGHVRAGDAGESCLRHAGRCLPRHRSAGRVGAWWPWHRGDRRRFAGGRTSGARAG